MSDGLRQRTGWTFPASSTSGFAALCPSLTFPVAGKAMAIAMRQKNNSFRFIHANQAHFRASSAGSSNASFGIVFLLLAASGGLGTFNPHCRSTGKRHAHDQTRPALESKQYLE